MCWWPCFTRKAHLSAMGLTLALARRGRLSPPAAQHVHDPFARSGRLMEVGPLVPAGCAGTNPACLSVGRTTGADQTGKPRNAEPPSLIATDATPEREMPGPF